MAHLFFNCSSLAFIDISSFNTENVYNMEGMSDYCTSLTSIKFGNNFNMNKAHIINSLFSHCFFFNR